MIRINLLPVKAAKRREQGQKQLLVGAGWITLVIVGIIVFHSAAESKINDLRTHNQELSTAIARLKNEIGDYELVRAQKDDLIRKKNAIERLQKNRSGPVWLMRELSDILTKGKGPTFNKDQYEELLHRDPNAALNTTWDPKRVWLLSYDEKAHQVKIHGAAKSDEDVAEFLKRLKLSAFFSDVYWQQTQPQFDQKLNVGYVTFDVQCRVNY